MTRAPARSTTRAVVRLPADRPVFVAAAGAQCSVGLTLPAVEAAVGGHLNAFALEPRIRSARAGAPFTCAWLETFGPRDDARTRMRAMAAAAAAEVGRATRDGAVRDVPIPVLLAVPAPRPGLDVADASRLAAEIVRALPVRPDGDRCLLQPHGHAGLFPLLANAWDWLAAGVGDAVLVGGVESYRDGDVLRWLDAAGRVRAGDEPLGWIPGEGAAFLVLANAEGLARLGIERPLAVLERVGVALEPRPWYTGVPTWAEGLTGALRAAFEGEAAESPPVAGPVTMPAGAPAAVYCDLNGDGWRADEWGYSYLRTAEHVAEPLVLHHPADCWGDVGAASGALLVALAAGRLARGVAGAPRAVVWAASDTTPLRGACVLSFPPRVM